MATGVKEIEEVDGGQHLADDVDGASDLMELLCDDCGKTSRMFYRPQDSKQFFCVDCAEARGMFEK